MSNLTFPLVSSQLDFPKEEERILEYWNDATKWDGSSSAFQASLAQSLAEQRPEFTFYDGPPFATGLPHYGHILAGTIKDVVTRYAHMNGFHVSRRFGWDTHGLPIEYQIDKENNIKSTADVEAMGIKAYNAKCRAIVMKYSKEWETVVGRMGRWIDFQNDYKTLDPSFMESVWWVFKSLYEKGLVFRGFKVMPYSTACHTPLSNFESGTDCYKELMDPAIVVSFPLLDDPQVKLLAWTTTPWTLPSNLAVCVGPDMKYLKVRDVDSGNIYILAESCLTTLYKKYKPNKKKKDKTPPPFEVLQEYKGRELEGLKYEPLFDYFTYKREDGAFRVVVDDYVTEGSGTGLVHQAPAYGEDDYRVCLANGIIQKDGGLVNPVDDDGCFTDEVPDFVGRKVKSLDKDEDVNRDVIRKLADMGRLVDNSNFTHPYPHCWRSGTPLIYKAVPSWFVNVPAIRDQLLKNNEKTYWVPAFVKEKRFHNWLADAQDWSVSRARYWGTPLPIWVSDDMEEVVVVGSVQELRDLTGNQDIVDLHRDSIDELTIPSKQGKGVLRRVPEVFDCWFESGSMPYAQVHYPFENKERFEQHQFPADFIAEGLDQTRGWFYTLMVISTALFDKPAFKNLIVNGLVLAEDGQKMSKSKQNYPPPTIVVHEHGADALRLYLINSPVVRAEPLKFRSDGVRDVVKDLFVPWFNSYRFFLEQHRRYEMSNPQHPFVLDPESAQVHLNSTNAMDRWILSSLQSLIAFFHQEMDAYRLYTILPRLVDYTNDLSKWYVRINKRRLKGDNGREEWQFALCTLYDVLLTLSRVMAPFTPFITEAMYQVLALGLDEKKRQKSVHFLRLPESNGAYVDKEIEEGVGHLKTVVDLGRVARDRAKVSFRVPLPSVVVVHRDHNVLKELQGLEEYIKLELNVRSVEFSSDVLKYGELRIRPNMKSLGKRLKKKARSVAVKMESMTSEQVEQLERDGTFRFDDIDEEVTIDDASVRWYFTGEADDFEVQENQAEGVMLMLNKKLDESCVAEGVARNFMSSIQSLRKEHGFLAEDELEVFYSAEGAVNNIIKDHVPFINEGIRINLLHQSQRPPQYEVLAEKTVDTDDNGSWTISLTRQKVSFSGKVDDDDVKQAVWELEARLGRIELRHQISQANNRLEVSVGDGASVSLEPGVDFHYSLPVTAQQQ